MKLSICIPVYNNEIIFEYSLRAAVKACINYCKDVEIVISDNASECNIEKIVKKYSYKYSSVDIVYNRNEVNEGLASNFLKVVDLASGDYCWIIGSDDFVKRNAVHEILELLSKDVDFVSIGIDRLDLREYYTKEIVLMREYFELELEKKLSDIDDCFFETKHLIWDELVNPINNTVMSGAVMTNIFRKKLWDKVDLKNMDSSNNFDNVENIYPHSAIFARTMIGRKAIYYKKALIIVGDGKRDWVGSNFWSGSLPIIYLKVLPEMIVMFKEYGLSKKILFKCKMYVSETIGRYYFQYIYYRYVAKEEMRYIDISIVNKNFRTYLKYPSFILGLFKGIIKPR